MYGVVSGPEKNRTRVGSKSARFYAAHLVKWLLGKNKEQKKKKFLTLTKSTSLVGVKISLSVDVEFDCCWGPWKRKESLFYGRKKIGRVRHVMNINENILLVSLVIAI